MIVKLRSLLLVLVFVISVTSFAANIYTAKGKVIPAKILSYDGEDIKFVLPVANVVISVKASEVLKISFDDETSTGTGLILKNGTNIPYAKLENVKDGKALFTFPCGELEINDLSNIAFVNFKKVAKLEKIKPFDFIVHPTTGGRFTAKLLSLKNGMYEFETKYGKLRTPWLQIKDMEKSEEVMVKDGVLIAGGMIINGKVSAFDGKYYHVVTSYGKFTIKNGYVFSISNKNATDNVNFDAFVQLTNGDLIAGEISSWNPKIITYKTPWGILKFQKDEITEIRMKKTAGIRVITSPPRANVKLDGTFIGKTPLKLPLALSGIHELVISKAGYQILDKKICAIPYMFLTLKYKLKYGDVWEKGAPMPTARDDLAAVTVNKTIYAIGGGDESNFLNTVQAYNPKNNRWKDVSPMPTARDGLAAVVNDGKIYAIGGENRNNFLDTVEVYDPQTDTWSSAADMPTPRNNLAAVAYKNKIYAIGGYDGDFLDTVEIYDVRNDSWTSATPMLTPRAGLAVVVCDGRIYAIGGWDGDSELGTVEVYDPQTGVWSSAADMPTPRDGFAAVTYGGKIYVLGGYAAETSVEVYDPKSDTWASVSPMPTARVELAATVYDGKIYVVGGYGDGELNTLEYYIPAEKIFPERTLPAFRDFSTAVSTPIKNTKSK